MSRERWGARTKARRRRKMFLAFYIAVRDF
jgi:hypothetical protein